ncbi:MAG: transposase [Thermoanaerobaculia bacterium]
MHRGKIVPEWLAKSTEQIEVLYLPLYRPELNPDEGRNADLKHAVTRRAPGRSRKQLKTATVCHLRRLSKSPARVQRFFHHPSVRYAA